MEKGNIVPLYGKRTRREQWLTEEGGLGCSNPPPPSKFRSFDKAEPNSQFRGKYIRNKLTRIRLSLIFLVVSCKALPASYDPHSGIFFSLRGMTWRKHKVPKIKKILPYEIKFLVPNYSWLQNPWLGGLPLPDPRCLCLLSSTEFLEPPPPPEKKSWVRHWLHLQNCYWNIYVADSIGSMAMVRRPCSSLLLFQM